MICNATITDVAQEQNRGLLAAPPAFGTAAPAVTVPSAGTAHAADVHLAKEAAVTEQGGALATSDGGMVKADAQSTASDAGLTTETVSGAALSVDDVTVVTPTGERVSHQLCRHVFVRLLRRD